MRTFAALCGLLVALLAAGCSGGYGSDDGSASTTTAASVPVERVISQSELEDAWPLTVPGGMLRCEGPGAVSFTTDEGITYAVNATAVRWSTANNLSWSDVRDIRAPDPNGSSRMLALGPLVAKGRALCRHRPSATG